MLNVQIPAAVDFATDLTLGDFNGDGRPDVAFPAWNHGAAGVMLTQPSGVGTPTFFPAVISADTIASGDFNGDGHLDLVTGSEWGPGIAVLMGHGDGTFGERLNLFASAAGTSRVVVGDFDGNGFDDFALGAASGWTLDVFYSVPEPSTAAIVGLGLGMVLGRRRRSVTR